MPLTPMKPSESVSEPDPDTPLSLTLTPAAIMDAAFASADQAHTGWESCVEPALVIADMTVIDDAGANYCRLVEQAYTEDEAPDVTWHDWAVELRVGDTYITAHWRTEEDASPSDLEWCAREAEDAFTRVCVLLGKRVRRGLVVDEPVRAPRPARMRH